MSNKLKTVPLETMLNKHIGKLGSETREAFENELRIDLLGQAIKHARQELNMTQEQLGDLVSVQKSPNFKD
jgi:hypothetical protein